MNRIRLKFSATQYRVTNPPSLIKRVSQGDWALHRETQEARTKLNEAIQQNETTGQVVFRLRNARLVMSAAEYQQYLNLPPGLGDQLAPEDALQTGPLAYALGTINKKIDLTI